MQIDTNKARAKEAAKCIGIAAETFSRLRADGIFIPNEDGRTFRIASVVKSWLNYKLGTATPGSLAEEKCKLIIEQRKRLEIDNRARVDELVEREDVSQALTEVMAIVATQLDGLPGRGAHELANISDPAETYAWIAAETKRMRNAAADEIEAYARATGPTGVSAEWRGRHLAEFE